MLRSFIIVLLTLVVLGCNKDTDETQPEPESRNFQMGFTTWPYGPNPEDVDDTYAYIEANGDIYAEHIDNSIPWTALINDKTLPAEFTDNIDFKVSKRLPNTDLLLSVSLLNLDRNELAPDLDGSVPAYTSFSDLEIEDAYFKYLDYLIGRFSPKYLVSAIEANELYINASEKWPGYKELMQNVNMRISQAYPNLRISESMTLHNLYQPQVAAPETYLNEVFDYMNQMDFAAISFYPFFKGLSTEEEFQAAFDFLHERLSVSVAFAETAHIAEDLIVPNLNLSIPGSESEQELYLRTLLNNAQTQNYEFVIWWAHRDYDALWATFPLEQQDIGQLWRDSGLLDEDGNERSSAQTWEMRFGE